MKKESVKDKSLINGIKEGSAASASSGFGDTFLPVFANFLNATGLQYGALSAFSSLLAPISQHFGNKLMESHQRKKIVSKFILLQALMWIPLAIISVIAFKYNSNNLLWFIIPIYSLIAIFGGLVYPAWFSMMGDLIPKEKRGRYFGRRDFFAIGSLVICSILGAAIIEYNKYLGVGLLGFSIVFLLAFAARLISYKLSKKYYDPKFKLNKKDEFSILTFIKKSDNYGKFAIYQFFFNFAIMVASPFFGFYLLSELGLNDNLIIFVIVMSSSSLFTALFIKIAGKFSDKYGNLKLFYIANIFFILSPLVWLVSNNIFWLILAPGIIAGIANASLGISLTNFTLDSIPKEKRGQSIAYTNILSGIGAFLGAFLGGALLDKIPSINGLNTFFIVFIIAAVLRFLVAIIFLPKIKEIRKVKEMHFINSSFINKAIHHEFHGHGIFMNHHKSK